jgi:hypothetical protein
LDPFGEWPFLKLPRGDAIEDIAFAINHVSQHKCRRYRATGPLAKEGRLRNGRLADNRHPAARPTSEPDDLKPVAARIVGDVVDDPSQIGEQRTPKIAVDRHCIARAVAQERGQLHIGELSGAGREAQAARPVPVLAMCTPDLGFELSRLAPDHRPIAELIGGTTPLQQAETLADRGTDAVGADNKIGVA